MAELLRDETAYFDQHEFDPSEGAGMYRELPPFERKLAHIGWHVGKIANIKMVTFLETSDDQLMRGDIIPNLALYATQLANMYELQDEEVIPRGNLQPFSLSRVDRQIRRAAGTFCRFIEASEHHSQANAREPYGQAARMMYVSAVELGTEYGVIDVASAQRLLMEERLGHEIPRSEKTAKKVETAAEDHTNSTPHTSGRRAMPHQGSRRNTWRNG